MIELCYSFTTKQTGYVSKKFIRMNIRVLFFTPKHNNFLFTFYFSCLVKTFLFFFFVRRDEYTY